MGVRKIWNTNGGINMGTDSYYINENNEFVIEDYNQQKPFSSFLPAVSVGILCQQGTVHGNIRGQQ